MFAVETTEAAEAEIEALFLRLNAWNPDVAGRWLVGLQRAIESLSSFPQRLMIVQTSGANGREVRRLLYRHGRTTYIILFSLYDMNNDSEDDTVRVLHIRHGAQDR